jgi:hypothetical protein
MRLLAVLILALSAFAFTNQSASYAAGTTSECQSLCTQKLHRCNVYYGPDRPDCRRRYRSCNVHCMVNRPFVPSH